MRDYKMLIGNKWLDASSKATFSVVNPANCAEIARVPVATSIEIDQAVKAARQAFPIWSNMLPEERCRILYQIAGLIEERQKEFALVECLDHGYPISQAYNFGVPGTIDDLKFAADISRSIMGDQVIRKDALSYIKREPVGVCALIIPWNVPLGLTVQAMAPALAAGNTCVIKPASLDCLSALTLGEVLAKTDLPPGTVNIITGPGGTTGEALARHQGVNFISFTGSSETGKQIMTYAAGTVKKTLMELGGKNPVIVLEDADVDSAAEGICSAQYANSGQTCASPGRIYVHEKIYNKFIEKFIASAKCIVTGDPSDEKTQMGPVVGADHRDKVEDYIKSGIQEGAKLAIGGKPPQDSPLNKGYFVLPTVFIDVTQNMKIAREEIFGPVASIIKFKQNDDIIGMANDTPYGLCASIWSSDITRAIRMSEEIEAGTVWINAHRLYTREMPWGGYKESGYGKTFSNLYGIESYTQRKVVTINLVSPTDKKSY